MSIRDESQDNALDAGIEYVQWAEAEIARLREQLAEAQDEAEVTEGRWMKAMMVEVLAREAAEAEAARLQEENASLQRELAEAHRWNHAAYQNGHGDATEAAEARLTELRTALKRYGKHGPYCGESTGGDGSGKCNCGLRAALASTPDREVKAPLTVGLSPEERAALRDDHTAYSRVYEVWICPVDEQPHPCPTMRVLDALEASEHEGQVHDQWCNWKLLSDHDRAKLEASEQQVAELRDRTERAIKQAEMWYERFWYESGALGVAAEELQDSRIEREDTDDILMDLRRGIAPPLPNRHLAALREETT